MVLVRSDATYIYSQYTLIGLTDRLGSSTFSFQFQYTKASIGLEYISQFRQNVLDPDISNHSEFWLQRFSDQNLQLPFGRIIISDLLQCKVTSSLPIH